MKGKQNKKSSKPQSPLEIVNQTESVSSTPEVKSSPLLKPMSSKPTSSPKPSIKIVTTLGIVLAGVLSGFVLSKQFSSSSASPSATKTESQVVSEGLKVGDVIGHVTDEFFSDPAEGVIQTGGIDGEGSHRLLRPGGEARNVYLTSSVIDLDLLVGHKVKVWGDTFAAQKAGWLMDVGKAEILELNADLPFEVEKD